jgi:serine/threonine protein kinase
MNVIPWLMAMLIYINRYRVIDMLGQGTFGQVVKCERVSTGELFSVKVIKNKSAYKTQSCMEIEILKKVLEPRSLL